LEQVASNYYKTLFIGSSSIGIKSANKRKARSKRFHSFLLPVLSFYEFIEMRNQQNPINFDDDYSNEQIGTFNQYLLDYINYGNYSSVVISSKISHEQVRLEGSRYLHQILLRDLPNLYGINKLYKLNSFTSLLAYNSGVETNVEELSVLTGFTQQTIVKYLNYLEHIFLIKRIYRFADRHKDERDDLYFRVYISNPSLRTALFTPLSEDDIRTEYMVETAILAQWQHIEKDMFYYCKHDHVIIDLIKVDESKNPIWVTDVRWQHPHGLAPNELDIVGYFCEKYGLISSMITTKQTRDIIPLSNVIHSYEPASLYCYTIGKHIVEDKLIDSQ
jgi:predicted AAA+ superfamily ATPase